MRIRLAPARLPSPQNISRRYIDVLIHSQDPGVSAIARERVEKDVATASRLGCSLVVFHTGFNPLVPAPAYEQHFYDRHAEFWPSLADRFPNLTICLENLWEPDPAILRTLFQRINHPRVRCCFDVAHAHVYSPISARRWIAALGDLISHMHWNDNYGDRDSHLPLGNGTIVWPAFLETTNQLRKNASVLLELRAIDDVTASLNYLKNLKSETGSEGTATWRDHLH